jgi:transcriptional regulator with XRE-family HTH domain
MFSGLRLERAMATARKKATLRGIKSIYRRENVHFLEALRAAREQAGLTQVELGERLGRPQAFVTGAERGVVRLDGLQIRDWLEACGSDLVTWAKDVEARLAKESVVKRAPAKSKAKRGSK